MLDFTDNLNMSARVTQLANPSYKLAEGQVTDIDRLIYIIRKWAVDQGCIIIRAHEA